jgi:hypothetical protein
VQQPIETLFKQIQHSVDFYEVGGVTSGAAYHIRVAYTNVFATGILMSACRRWNEKEQASKNWNNFKIHVAAAYRQHKQIQGESASTSGYHTANTAVAQTEDGMTEAAIRDLSNLATATSTYHGVVAALTEANARLAR